MTSNASNRMPASSHKMASFSYWSKYLYVAVSLVYLFVSLHSPLGLLIALGHDDGLFVSNAFSIFTSGWLPDYNQYVLAKGSGFPIFLAINAITGLPITLSLALVFVASVLTLSGTLNRIGFPPVWSFIVFALIIANLSLIPTRIIRDNLYTSLTIFAVVLALELFVVPKDTRRPLFVVFGLGIMFGSFFLTREEFVWVAPFLAFLFGFFVWSNRRALNKLTLWKPTFIALVGFLIPVLGVSTLNYSHYGVFQSNDFTQGSFPSTLGKLQDVQSRGDLIPYVPVAKDIRAQVYAVSPRFAELEQSLEAELLWWTEIGCQTYPDTCGDYAGGWFAWALRDAVAQRGYYEDARLANQFYEDVTREVEAACYLRTLICDARQIPLVPRITTDEIWRVAGSLTEAMAFTLDQNSSFSIPPSSGTAEQISKMNSFLGSPKITPPVTADSIWVSGWYKPKGWIKTVCEGEGREIEIPRLSSPDLVSAFSDEKLSLSRFRVDVSALLDCAVVQQSDNGLESISTPWRDVVNGASQLNNGQVDSIETPATEVGGDAVVELKTFVTDNQARVIKALFPLAIVSNLILLLLLVRKPQYWVQARTLTVVFWAILILIATRLTLISLIHGTSFPAINVIYLGPAIALVPVICVLPIFILFKIGITWWREKNQSSTNLSKSPKSPRFKSLSYKN